MKIEEQQFSPSDAVSLVDRACESLEAWDRLIQRKLLSWIKDPSQIEDDSIEAPSAQVIRIAIALATKLRNRGDLAPSNIVPDGSGGIVFERRKGVDLQSYHIWDDGKVEYYRFTGSQVVDRSVIASPPNCAAVSGGCRPLENKSPFMHMIPSLAASTAMVVGLGIAHQVATTTLR